MVAATTSKGPANMGRPVIFGTGLIALDVIVNAERAGDPVLAAGGTCGNVLAALSFLGWAAYPVARLNGDSASRVLQEDLLRWDVALDFATQAPSAATPIILQTIRRDPLGRPAHSFSLTCPECRSWFPRFKAVRSEAAERVLTWVKDNNPEGGAQVFFFDRVSRASLMLAEAFAMRGAVIVFEPSGIGKKALFEEALRLAHVLKYSRQRLPDLSVRRVLSDRRLLEIETRGEEGLRYRSTLTSWAWRTRPAITGPTAVDSVGAGDWCTAGLLTKIAAKGLPGLKELSGEELGAAIAFSQAAATLACGYEGARGVMYALNLDGFREGVKELLNERKTPRATRVGRATEAWEQSSSAITEVCPSCS